MTIFHLILLSHLMTYIHFIEFVFFLFFSPKSKTLGFFPVSWRCVIFQNGSFTGEFTLCFFLFIFALTSLHSHHEFHSWKKCNISSFFFFSTFHLPAYSMSQFYWVFISICLSPAVFPSILFVSSLTIFLALSKLLQLSVSVSSVCSMNNNST